MRRAALVLLAAASLASCTRPEHPDWMIGRWVFQQPAVQGATGCAGGVDPRVYSAGGFYLETDAAEYGRWEVRGKRLIHHILRRGGRPIPAAQDTSYIFRLDERGPDRLDVNRGPDPQMTMIRCSRNADGAFAPGMAH